MKERPILFSAPMVRAILSGQKTMTRRVIKPASGSEKFIFDNPAFHRYKYTHMWTDLKDQYCAYFETGPTEESKYGFAESFICPYGQPGDRMWVRETFYYEEHMHDLDDDEPDLPGGLYSRRIIYRASWPDYIMVPGRDKWKPSIFMPRAFSRITLEITNVRVERLNDISEEDARREGADGLKYSGQGFEHCIYREAFRTLWESINGPGSWDANPLVWVVEFKKVEA